MEIGNERIHSIQPSIMADWRSRFTIRIIDTMVTWFRKPRAFGIVALIILLARYRMVLHNDCRSG